MENDMFELLTIVSSYQLLCKHNDLIMMRKTKKKRANLYKHPIVNPNNSDLVVKSYLVSPETLILQHSKRHTH